MLPEVACPDCQASVAADATYCGRCGASVTRPPEAADPAAKGPGRPTRDAMALDQLREATLGQYEILGELGRGGMAVVYLAHDIALDRKVAIKLISPFLLTEETAERFKREARTAAGLSHPHIIPIYAVRETESLLYFVMKYIAGPSLESVIRDSGTLPIPIVQAVLSQAGEALGYAHRNGIVHRDVKPGNIMVDEEGWVVVTDFGIAKAMEAGGLTTTGTTVGTPTHMSPEQCLAHPVTGASDQYSLGVVAYEMVSGSVPFPEGTPMAMMYAHLNKAALPLTDARPECPATLASAVARMLAKDPAERWPTMEDAIKAIGTPDTGPNEPVRRGMIEMARRGAASRTMSFPSTPKSPIPATSRTRLSASTRVRPPNARRVLAWGIPILLGVAAVALGVGLFLGRSPSVAGVGPAAPAVAPLSGADSAARPAPEERRLGVVPTPTPEPSQPGSPSVSVTPSAPRLTVGERIQLHAEARNAAGELEPGRAVTWSSSAPDVVQVSGSGEARAVATGRATVTATSGTARRSVAITVAQAPESPPLPVALVQVVPGSGTVQVGGSLGLDAVLRDSTGRILTDRSVEWESSDRGVATVSDSGVVVGRGPGVVQVRAASGGVRGGAVVTVTAPPVREATPVDPGPAVRRLLERYAQAIAERRVAGIEALFPAIPGAVRQSWVELFQAYDEVTATLVPGTVAIAPAGDTASFDLSLTLKNRRETQQVVLKSRAELRQANGAWAFTRIEQTFAGR